MDGAGEILGCTKTQKPISVVQDVTKELIYEFSTKRDLSNKDMACNRFGNR